MDNKKKYIYICIRSHWLKFWVSPFALHFVKQMSDDNDDDETPKELRDIIERLCHVSSVLDESDIVLTRRLLDIIKVHSRRQAKQLIGLNKTRAILYWYANDGWASLCRDIF